MIMNVEKLERYYEIYRELKPKFYAEPVAWIDARELPAGDAVATAMLNNAEKKLRAAVDARIAEEA